MIRTVKRLSRKSTFATLIMSLRMRETDDTSPEDVAALKATLGDSLREDGSIDFDRLREITAPVDFAATTKEAGRAYAPLASAHHS